MKPRRISRTGDWNPQPTITLPITCVSPDRHSIHCFPNTLSRRPYIVFFFFFFGPVLDVPTVDVALQPALLARAQSHGKQEGSGEPLSENRSDLTSAKDDTDDAFTPKTSFLTQFSLISARNWQNLVRNKALLLTHVIVAIILGRMYPERIVFYLFIFSREKAQ